VTVNAAEAVAGERFWAGAAVDFVGEGVAPYTLFICITVGYFDSYLFAKHKVFSA
jgi:hypothetical protein